MLLPYGYLPSLFARIHREYPRNAANIVSNVSPKMLNMRREHRAHVEHTQRWRKHAELYIYLHRVNDLNVKMVFLFSAETDDLSFDCWFYLLANKDVEHTIHTFNRRTPNWHSL